MTSLVIDSYIKLPQAVVDVLDEGQPIFHRVIIEPTTKDSQPTTSPVAPATNSAFIITNVDKIHSSDHISIYTAKLDMPDKVELVDVVLKISKAGGPRNDAIWREYQTYEELAQFQGSVIPRCYGLFQAVLAEDIDEEPDVVSCLVLAFGGEATAAELNKNTRDFNLSVMKALEALHDAGYTHGSLQPSNILNKNGAAVLIDLEFVKGDHKCGRKASVKENGLENNSDDFGCSEIYNVARKMDLWKKSA
ncbi:hypothetical protein Agabi119p4_5930 [Agaricus bisporus var. burnettii]|uniref:Protein kinase domain-containing protein n=2 Tax=Agaricus bisporus TaxID=5341 RepID=A0A8H7F0W5_AGABI|nr:hypothetical protein Agabi119p4_5930 [Agaricus bisporus var. burnettii]